MSTTNLTFRKQETKRISERMKQTEQEIDQLSERLHAGMGDITPSVWSEMLAQYYSALRRYELDETYLEQLNSKGKPSKEELKRTSKKEYKNNYRY
ncbi:MAG: hypothetical protein RR415_11760 [Ruthenibacterium sp.]